jgi:uncharacterized protein GlcG (DUF336 family)
MKLMLDQANAVAQRCVNEAKRIGIAQAIAVVNASGELIVLQRMDGAPLARGDLALGKAFAAVFYGRSTRSTLEAFRESPELLEGSQSMLSGRMFVWPGGLPIILSSELVGGIGVSGATGDQDEQVAAEGLRALAEQ